MLVLIGFVHGRFRYDMVALAALVFLAALEIVPRGEAFEGFGHPAVITVAAILVVSRGLENSGVVDLISRQLTRFAQRPETLVGSQTTVVAAASGFMNNVGALALMMPVAIRVARRAGHARAIVLMPLAFASLLGGMVTVIGTPPNIIVATSREEPFAMFDFAPVGIAVAVAGILFLTLVGWRLIPRRDDDDEATFAIEGYLTEVVVPPDAKVVGMRIREIEEASGGSASVVAVVRGERRLPAPSGFEVVAPNDVLVLEADVDELGELLTETGLQTVPDREAEKQEEEDALAEASGISRPVTVGSREELLGSDEVELMEVVVRPGGMLSGRSASGLRLRDRFGVNLIAIARQGGAIRGRLNEVRIERGDVLLLQAPREVSGATLTMLGCLPLAERGLRFRAQPRVLAGIAIFGGALLASAVLNQIPIQFAVVAAALAMGVTGLVTLREAYESIDWPILVLLGAMLPVGASLESTGAAARIADWIVLVAEGLPLVVVIALMLVTAMMLSDIVNNAAAAVLLIPIALSIASGLGVSEDALLMAVAIGASSAFLTPIGHQSNVLVMGPGGYQFGDYWKVGLPLEVVIVLVASPMLALVWG